MSGLKDMEIHEAILHRDMSDDEELDTEDNILRPMEDFKTFAQ